MKRTTIMFGRLLCRLGLHRVWTWSAFLPSIDAPIVTDFIYAAGCSRCGRVIAEYHSHWDGTRMVEVEA